MDGRVERLDRDNILHAAHLGSAPAHLVQLRYVTQGAHAARAWLTCIRQPKQRLDDSMCDVQGRLIPGPRGKATVDFASRLDLMHNLSQGARGQLVVCQPEVGSVNCSTMLRVSGLPPWPTVEVALNSAARLRMLPD